MLFIDEAYSLRLEGSSDSAGQECVNTLVKESEDRAGELVIILTIEPYATPCPYA